MAQSDQERHGHHDDENPDISIPGGHRKADGPGQGHDKHDDEHPGQGKGHDKHDDEVTPDISIPGGH